MKYTEKFLPLASDRRAQKQILSCVKFASSDKDNSNVTNTLSPKGLKQLTAAN